MWVRVRSHSRRPQSDDLVTEGRPPLRRRPAPVPIEAMTLIRAAGGVVWREEDGVARLAVIHRPRRGDWSLPKGKLDDGEGWEEAALREVEEETGCAARLAEFAASTWYVPGRTPQVVVFWNMVLQREDELDAGDEVAEVRWLKPRAALERLDHENERHVLERALLRREARLRGGRADVRADIAAARARLLRQGLRGRIDGETLGMGLARLDQAEDAVLDTRAVKARAHLAAAARIADGARARLAP
jgi:8-oxo-dGTP diphosphatase